MLCYIMSITISNTFKGHLKSSVLRFWLLFYISIIDFYNLCPLYVLYVIVMLFCLRTDNRTSPLDGHFCVILVHQNINLSIPQDLSSCQYHWKYQLVNITKDIYLSISQGISTCQYHKEYQLVNITGSINLSISQRI